MHKKETIRTKDGHTLGLRIYLPFTSFTRVIMLAPSALHTQADYFEFARYFQHFGYCVVSFDYRGVGDSAPEQLKGFNATLQQWAKHDIDAVILFVRQKFPIQELIYIGHGIGGEIPGLAPAIQYINKMVLINSSLSCTRYRQWQDKLWVGSMNTLIRMVNGLFGYFPGKSLARLNNLPQGVMEEWIRWCRNDDGLFDDYTDNNYRKLHLPLLAYSFSDDWRSREKGVKALLDHFTSADISWHHMPAAEVSREGVGHSGFFSYSKSGKLWKELTDWIAGKQFVQVSHAGSR